MSKYEIGRDFQELRSRIERLEACLPSDRATPSNRGVGIALGDQTAGGVEHHESPFIWKAEKHAQLPPFINGILGLRPETQFDIAPESKTWPCHPEPLILYINWFIPFAPPVPDEFYRLENQSFSIIRVSNPNSGVTTCTAVYAAQLVASGRSKSAVFYPVNTGAVYSSSNFQLSLKNAQGATLVLLKGPRYSINCHDNYPFVQAWDFNPGLYDLVAGATWQIVGDQNVVRC